MWDVERVRPLPVKGLDFVVVAGALGRSDLQKAWGLRFLLGLMGGLGDAAWVCEEWCGRGDGGEMMIGGGGIYCGTEQLILAVIRLFCIRIEL